MISGCDSSEAVRKPNDGYTLTNIVFEFNWKKKQFDSLTHFIHLMSSHAGVLAVSCILFPLFLRAAMKAGDFLPQPQFREGSSFGLTTCATFMRRRSRTAWSRIPASSTGFELILLIRSATFCTTEGPFRFPSTK